MKKHYLAGGGGWYQQEHLIQNCDMISTILSGGGGIISTRIMQNYDEIPSTKKRELSENNKIISTKNLKLLKTGL